MRPSRYRSDYTAYGLYFGTDDRTPLIDTDAEAIARDPLIREKMGGSFYVVPVEGGYVATKSLNYIELPDQAKDGEAPVLMASEGQLHRINLYDRFNDCREMVKLALGCAECPYKGIECMRRALPDGRMEIATQLDDSLADGLRHKETKIADFTFASPTMTIPDGYHFTPGARHYADHDFSRIRTMAEIRARGAKTGAELRRFRRDQCMKCPLSTLKKGGCGDQRTCQGAYPTAEEMTKQTLDLWLPRVKASGFSEKEFWFLARVGGRPSSRCHHRRRISLGGLAWADGHFEAAVWYTKRPTGVAYAAKTMAELDEHFPELRNHMGDLVGPSYMNEGRGPSDELKALFFLTMNVSSMYSRSGWGSYREWRLVEREISSHDVRVEWMEHYGRTSSTTVRDYAELYSRVVSQARRETKLPFDQSIQPGREDRNWYYSRHS